MYFKSIQIIDKDTTSKIEIEIDNNLILNVKLNLKISKMYYLMIPTLMK